MERIAGRARFQGVLNIIRFNWHFYLLAIVGLVLLGMLAAYSSIHWVRVLYMLAGVAVIWSVFVSLAVSMYVYDLSGFYTFSWLRPFIHPGAGSVANINAGFDETSGIIAELFPSLSLHVYDFYNPGRHTEVSIRRARAAYGSFPGTVAVDTATAFMAAQPFDYILLVLSAHEIRSAHEAVTFFSSLRAQLRVGGQIIVVEHLRDGANFAAYTLGVFHFFGRRRWLRVFTAAGLHLQAEEKINPFITVFCLSHGVTA